MLSESKKPRQGRDPTSKNRIWFQRTGLRLGTRTLTAASLEEATRCAIARGVFAQQLSKDPRVVDLLDEWWTRQSKAYKASSDLADSLDKIAEMLQLQSRKNLWKKGYPLQPTPSAEERHNHFLERNHREYQRLFSKYVSNVKSFDAEKKKLLNSKKDPACRFVQDVLQIPWPWAAAEVIQLLQFKFIEHAFGMKFTYHYNATLLAPRVELKYETKPGEPLSDAEARLDEQYENVRSEFRKVKTSKSRLPKGRGNHIKQGAKWLYLLRFNQPKSKKQSLAKELHQMRASRGSHKQQFPDCGCRQQVDYRIRLAESLLNKSPYRFPKKHK